MTWRLLLALALSASPAPGGATSPTPGSGPAQNQAAEVVTGPGGYIRVTEIGHPPLGMAGVRARSVARDNALHRARRKLLEAILALTLGDGRKLRDVLTDRPEQRAGLKTVLEGAEQTRVELAGDAVEITLTVRMDGERGLARYLDSVGSRPPRGP